MSVPHPRRGPRRSVVSADVRGLVTLAEHAVRDGDAVVARECYVQATKRAASHRLWRMAIRCCRRALELDLADRDIVHVAHRISGHLGGDDARAWAHYASVLQRERWPHFGARGAQVVIGDHGAFVTCPGVGLVLELLMSAPGLVEAAPVPQFHGMPSAMALILLRRSLFMRPREFADDPATIQVAFRAGPAVRLDELGDWHAGT